MSPPVKLELRLHTPVNRGALAAARGGVGRGPWFLTPPTDSALGGPGALS